MNWFNYFNTTIGSCMIITLIAVDYLRKYITDRFQRKLLIVMLGSMFVAAIFDYISLTIERNPGEKIKNILSYTWSVYLLARNCCYYFSAVLIDYFAHLNHVRTKTFFKTVAVFLFLYGITLIPNIKYGYYFYISRENVYMPGIYYSFQTLISYFPIVIILIDVGLITRTVKRSRIIYTIIFVILSAVGATLDIIFKTTNLIWPCITAAALYIYFFIIRTDSKTDSLTGIENRNSFNEYIKNISSQINDKKYAFIMFDIIRFKEINNALGHVNGDNALRDLALIIKACTKAADFAARLGGDDFIIVTSGASYNDDFRANDVQMIIDRVHDAINRQNKKLLKPYQIYISYSYGVYASDSGLHIQDFLLQLDNEMNKYKESHCDEFSTVITADLVKLF